MNLARSFKSAIARRLSDRADAIRLNKAKRKVALFQPPLQINAGCGTIHFDGWLNIDIDHDQSHLDVLWDVSKCLPVPDGSCDVIYSEHMLEHLSVDQGQVFLRECLRSLRPGGTVRIAMPSLDDLIDKCANGNWRDQEWLHQPQWESISTRAEMMNVMFRWWGHQWIYDREELHRRLAEAGFHTIKDVEWGKSDIKTLQNRETRSNSLLICEAVRE